MFFTPSNMLFVVRCTLCYKVFIFRVVIEKELNLPGVCVWAGISSDGIIGPYSFQGTVNGKKYLEMLDSWLWPKIQDHAADLFFQKDGAPVHFHHDVITWLDTKFDNRWIGRGGPIPWPARSPDLT